MTTPETIFSKTRTRFPSFYTVLSGRKYRMFLFAILLLVWIWASIEPLDRSGWFMENVLVVFIIALFMFAGAFFRLSNVSYTLLVLFAIFHIIASHYTYSHVPFGYTLGDWFGTDRNMYDRFVHFLFGLLLAYPVREIFIRLAQAKGFWSYFFPIELTFATSAIYEVGEWIIWTNVSSSNAVAFLGTQGDIWDAQKDMLLAGIGAIITMTAVLFFHMKFDRNLWREMRKSIRPPKNDQPLGEDELKRLL